MVSPLPSKKEAYATANNGRDAKTGVETCFDALWHAKMKSGKANRPPETSVIPTINRRIRVAAPKFLASSDRSRISFVLRLTIIGTEATIASLRRRDGKKASSKRMMLAEMAEEGTRYAIPMSFSRGVVGNNAPPSKDSNREARVRQKSVSITL